jgi:hypothetical protein
VGRPTATADEEAPGHVMYARGQYVRIFDGEVVKIARPTLPELSFLKNGPPVDTEPERRETAARFAEHRTIRSGLDAWAEINKAQSFEAWKRIGAALSVGKAHALRVTQANAPMGRWYSLAFSEWIKAHGFEKMPAATRSVAIELHEHAEAITAWRDTLPERLRKSLVHPLSVTRRWRASKAHNGKCPADPKRDAVAACARFRSSVEALPADQARPLWQAALSEAQSMTMPTPLRRGGG